MQQQKKDQSKFYGDLLEKRRTEDEKEQEKCVIQLSQDKGQDVDEYLSRLRYKKKS